VNVVVMAVHPLVAPDDEGYISGPILERILRSLTARDAELLGRLEKERRVDVDTLEADGYDAASLFWMAHYALVSVEIDQADRVYLVRKKEGKIALDARRGIPQPARKRRGRPPMDHRF
jgi:hypothetical protein